MSTPDPTLDDVAIKAIELYDMIRDHFDQYDPKRITSDAEYCRHYGEVSRLLGDTYHSLMRVRLDLERLVGDGKS